MATQLLYTIWNIVAVASITVDIIVQFKRHDSENWHRANVILLFALMVTSFSMGWVLSGSCYAIIWGFRKIYPYLF
jgi:hypothetical protein